MSMTPPLNSPLEAGLRAVFLLATTFPSAFSLSALVEMDHALLHTGESDGPPSIHPDLPGSIGELSIKYDLIKAGLDAMMRADLVAARPTLAGFEFRATENAVAFVTVLDSDYAHALRDRAAWVQQNLEGAGSFEESGIHALVSRWLAAPGRPRQGDR